MLLVQLLITTEKIICAIIPANPNVRLFLVVKVEELDRSPLMTSRSRKFTYFFHLGIVVRYNNTFQSAMKHNKDKAMKALSTMELLLSKYDLAVEKVLHLFAIAISIFCMEANYGAMRVWSKLKIFTENFYDAFWRSRKVHTMLWFIKNSVGMEWRLLSGKKVLFWKKTDQIGYYVLLCKSSLVRQLQSCYIMENRNDMGYRWQKCMHVSSLIMRSTVFWTKIWRSSLSTLASDTSIEHTLSKLPPPKASTTTRPISENN